MVLLVSVSPFSSDMYKFSGALGINEQREELLFTNSKVWLYFVCHVAKDAARIAGTQFCLSFLSFWYYFPFLFWGFIDA